MFIPITLSNYFSPMEIITLPKPFSFSTQNSLQCIDCSDVPCALLCSLLCSKDV